MCHGVRFFPKRPKIKKNGVAVLDNLRSIELFLFFVRQAYIFHGGIVVSLPFTAYHRGTFIDVIDWQYCFLRH